LRVAKVDEGATCKGFPLLRNPVIAAELWAYIQSKKWAMDPEKLTAFSANKLVSAVADKYHSQWNALGFEEIYGVRTIPEYTSQSWARHFSADSEMMAAP
jgi:hypothetical protein